MLNNKSPSVPSGFLSIMMFRIWICACFLSVSVGIGCRILVVYPVPDAAHAALGDAVVRTLLAADHEVTYVSVLPKMSHNPNLTYVDISSILSEHNGKQHDSSRHWTNGRSANDILRAGPQFAQDALHHQTFQELLHDSTLTFDAVVVDWFYSGLLAPLASLYECPLIWYTSEDISWQNLKLVHEEPSPAYSVNPLGREMPSLPFSVKERLYQLGMQIYINLWSYYTTHFVEIPAYDAIYRTPFQLRKRLLPNYGEVVHNGSLLLVNSHPPLGQMLPVPQNAKLIGGHHIRQPIKRLPKTLQSFLNNAKNGVIYMNIPHLQGKLPKKLQEQLLDAFGQLEQLVLWQYSGPVEYVPRNVRVMEKGPQLSILNHPNTKIFISDGSLSSLIAATHCGVPVVAVPTAAGQGVNVDLMVTRGLGHRVDLDQYLPWKLQGAVGQIMVNQSYKNNAQQASVVFQRRITPANDELISWVNLVLSTQGAAHLRSPAVQVPALERYHMDLWILVVLALWFLSKVMKVIQVHLKDLEKKNQ